MAVQLSPRARIALKCKDCIHDPRAAGNWRQQVALCQCRDCPLWPIRPVPTNQGRMPARVLEYYGIEATDPVIADLVRRGVAVEMPPASIPASAGAISGAIGAREYQGKGDAA